MTHCDVGLLIQSGHFVPPTLIGKRWLSLFLDGDNGGVCAYAGLGAPSRLTNTDPAT